MKYGISLLLLISCTAHTGPLCSRPEPRMPLQYLYVTPTLIDNNSQEPLYTGKYSYVNYSDDTLQAAQRPSQPHDRCFVDIEEQNLSMHPNPHVRLPLKSFLAITYSIKRRTASGIEIVQEPEKITFNY